MNPVQLATVDTKGQAPTRKTTWGDCARVYAQRGWPVFPVHIAVRGECSCGKPACTSKGKHPQTAHSFYDATTDEDVIRTWGEVDYPRANIGIRTGKESGLVVLDIDPDKGGEESLRQLEEQYEPLPETVTVVSGGGGRHLYFQHPGGLMPTTTGKLGSGLDTRGMAAILWLLPLGMSAPRDTDGRQTKTLSKSSLPLSRLGCRTSSRDHPARRAALGSGRA
jgi:Bifunctional DNA primase/polymerase, N-terminal